MIEFLPADALKHHTENTLLHMYTVHQKYNSKAITHELLRIDKFVINFYTILVKHRILQKFLYLNTIHNWHILKKLRN